jgi:SAM-dependent methyltransferase
VRVDATEQAVAWATEQHAPQVYAIAAVEGGGAQGGQVSFRHAEAYVLPFADGSVDGVVTMRLLEEVGDLPRLVRELQRVLKPGFRPPPFLSRSLSRALSLLSLFPSSLSRSLSLTHNHIHTHTFSPVTL